MRTFLLQPIVDANEIYDRLQNIRQKFYPTDIETGKLDELKNSKSMHCKSPYLQKTRFIHSKVTNIFALDVAKVPDTIPMKTINRKNFGQLSTASFINLVKHQISWKYVFIFFSTVQKYLGSRRFLYLHV